MSGTGPAVGRPQRVVAVPVDLALVFTAGRGWHYEPAPPAWWFEEQERLLATDGPQCVLSLVPPLREPRTPCMPGSGPCRRRHEHTSARRGRTVPV
jgi:hypothetical protein